MDTKRPPPVKVLSGQLRTAGSRGQTDSGDGVHIRVGPGRSLLASLVWMQGSVLEVQLDQNTVLLMDETGTFAVQGVNNIPKGKPCLFQGIPSHKHPFKCAIFVKISSSNNKSYMC